MNLNVKNSVCSSAGSTNYCCMKPGTGFTKPERLIQLNTDTARGKKRQRCAFSAPDLDAFSTSPSSHYCSEVPTQGSITCTVPSSCSGTCTCRHHRRGVWPLHPCLGAAPGPAWPVASPGIWQLQGTVLQWGC